MGEYRAIIGDESKFLSHYGTKGMKWGVWNNETRARYEGNPSSGGGAGWDDEDEDDEEITEKTFDRSQEKELDKELKKLGIDPDDVDPRQHPGDAFMNKLEAYWEALDEGGYDKTTKEGTERLDAKKSSDERKTAKEIDKYKELDNMSALDRTSKEQKEYDELDKKYHYMQHSEIVSRFVSRNRGRRAIEAIVSQSVD